MPQKVVTQEIREEAAALWHSFWEEIVCTNGEIDLQQLQLELLDFWRVMQYVPQVYMHVTGSRVSKLLTDPIIVNSLADEHYQELCEAVSDELWPHLPPEDREL